MIFVRLLLLTVACFAVGCASGPPKWEQANIAAITPTTSAMIFEVSELQGVICGNNGAILRLQRVSDGATVELHANRGMLDNESPVRAQAIEPGTWRPLVLDCRNYGAFGVVQTSLLFELPLDNVIGPIEIQPGEIVYPGTFQTYRAEPDERWLVRMVDAASTERAKLAARYPHLAARFVARPAPLQP